ncbi:hypothetical protein K438DRAFT_1954094 [Mycena galopus ATCC 62051]|nr:hypothetical protein K438DRAFT_1954094 [Mycena galopus ATCC 62051]
MTDALLLIKPMHRSTFPPQDAPSAFQWGKSSQLAEETLQARIHAYDQHQLKRTLVPNVPRLLDLTAELLGAMKETDLCLIPSVIIKSNLSSWTQIPYVVMRRACVKFFSNGDPKIDVDEWILGNEKWLRERRSEIPWQRGLVNLKRVEPIFPSSSRTQFGRSIARPQSLPGLELLCDARTSEVTIQPSTKDFKKTFERMSHGLLRNLNWSNILVAGGIALGTLLSVDAPNGAEIRQWWDGSDIDLYIYGLSAGEATQKIHHIYETLRSNVNGRPTLAVRNTKTITFYVNYPTRRIQVILKLAESPKDVLLNFDLDICAIGWDGTDLWMLPRAARAIETGCNVFTMHLVRGHYLSERRASQPQRVFKYANKGYGIQILPSYLKSLTRSPENVEATFPGQDLSNLDINRVASDARAWVEAKLLQLDGQKVRYSDMDDGLPRRSCLTLFTLFMRNVAYWEIRRQESLDPEALAYTSYEDTYNDHPNNVANYPEYKWNSSFRLEPFKSFISQSNQREVQAWIRTDFMGRLRGYGVVHGDELEAVQRLTYSSRIEILLDASHDPKIPVLLPCDFAAYANVLVKNIQAEAQLVEAPILQPVVSYTSTDRESDPRSALYIWSVTSKLMWQRQDRRINEYADILRRGHGHDPLL